MKTYKIAAAATVALLVGVGSASAYSGNFVQDTPSLAFGHQATVSQGGANLVIPGTASPVYKPVRGPSAPLWEPIETPTPGTPRGNSTSPATD